MIERLTRHLVRPAALRVRHIVHEHNEPLGARLRCLSFNMQAGMGMAEAHHYLTRSWQHLLPHPDSREHLMRIGQLLADYDIVALQEVDGGSLRSAYINQVEHLAEQGGFGWCHQQLNRDLGPLGQFSNGMLSRLQPAVVEEYALPGLRGRGALLIRFRLARDQQLAVLNLHLALTQQGRRRQLAFVAELIQDIPHVVIMGDLNCTVSELTESALGRRDWRWLDDALPTYPSWRPLRQIDHILVSPGLQITAAMALDVRLSDHCPLALELTLPAELLG
jgi:endonuclease/exonuclease/phosphatase family metal-dependent hydrolase